MSRFKIYDDQPKRLQKKDFLTMCGLSIMLLFFCVFINEFQTIAVIISLITAVLILVFYFTTTINKVLTENEIRLNIIITGITGSVICNLLIAIYKETAILKIILTFAVLTAISFAVAALLALLIDKISMKSKNANKSVSKQLIVPFAMFGAIMGRFISRYCIANNIEVPLDIVIYILNIICMMIYAFYFIKLKKSEKKNDSDFESE